METLQSVLAAFNQRLLNRDEKWHFQFSNVPFPSYWRHVFYLLAEIRGMGQCRIREIGAGYGDVSAIAMYLGFKDVAACERNREKAAMANEKLQALFQCDGIVENCDFEHWGDSCQGDVVIMVNCVYADNASNKGEYIGRLKRIVNDSGDPHWFIYEAVDGKYDGDDAAFPELVRLVESDLVAAFPDRTVVGWDTYRRPENRSDKRIYLLTRRDP